jgi:hypothetical protein
MAQQGQRCPNRPDKFFCSNHMSFVKVLEVAGRANQAIELDASRFGTGLRARRFMRLPFPPLVRMSLDIDNNRRYMCSSRGEFTVAKDL